MKKPKIMICDDNHSVHDSLSLYLQDEGMDVLSVYDGESALKELRQRHVDLIILDIMLPKLFGTDVCREIRRVSDVPIIILSAKSDESDRIVGLELGADDYVTKPFSPKEVTIRVKSILRRVKPWVESPVQTLGKVTVNNKAYDVQVNGKPVRMTTREVEVLRFLISHVGEVVSRERLLNEVWGYEYYGDVRTVDTLIARLRGKIHEKEAGIAFRSVYGVGYMIEERKDD